MTITYLGRRYTVTTEAELIGFCFWANDARHSWLLERFVECAA